MNAPWSPSRMADLAAIARLPSAEIEAALREYHATHDRDTWIVINLAGESNPEHSETVRVSTTANVTYLLREPEGMRIWVRDGAERTRASETVPL